MRPRIFLLAMATTALNLACGTEAEDCHNTLTCPLPPVVIVVEDDAGACGGVCAPIGDESDGWSPYPFLVWIGPGVNLSSTPFACPSNAKSPGFSGGNDPDASFVCGACTCEPPTGTCGLPATLTATAASCADAGPSTPTTPFDPPDGGWDGGCTTTGAIDGGQLCDGGLCVQSITVAPLTLNEAGCVPMQLTPQQPQGVPWSTIARACYGSAYGPCADASQVCVPAPPSPSPQPSPWSWSLCISQKGDDTSLGQCPTGYTVRYTFYKDADDTRACSACACGSPQGSSCSSLISVYTDSACSTPALLDAITVSASTSMCIDAEAGSPLGSKSATTPLYTPGTCPPSGGDETGTLVPTNPTTFCCLP